MNDRSKLGEQLRMLQKMQKHDLQGLVKPLYVAFHGGKAKTRLDAVVEKIKADKTKKEKEAKEKLQKEKKAKKENK